MSGICDGCAEHVCHIECAQLPFAASPRPPFGGPSPTFGPSNPSKSKRWGSHYHIHSVTRSTLPSAVALMNRWLWRNSKRIQPITMTYHFSGTDFSILLFYKRIEVKE